MKTLSTIALVCSTVIMITVGTLMLNNVEAHRMLYFALAFSYVAYILKPNDNEPT